jgi:hypothetical protein
LSSGESDVTCRTSEARIAAHLRAEEESFQEHAGEGLEKHQILEEEDKARPGSVQSSRPTEIIKLHATVVRTIAITPATERDGNALLNLARNTCSEPSHVKPQVGLHSNLFWWIISIDIPQIP